MPSESPRIYLDSCVYISCIQKDDERHESVSAIIAQAKSGEIILIASTMVIAEVTKLRKLDADGVDVEEQAAQIRHFFENDYFKFRAVDRKTAEEAAAISRKHGIKPPDAIHVATALRWKCVSFQTYDGENGEPRKLIDFDGKIGSPPLKIELPHAFGDDQHLLF